MKTLSNKKSWGLLSVLSLLSAVMALGSTSAQAVPSFARQTGMACGACHTIFPALTQFGRQFKLNGYTLQAVDNAISSPGEKEEEKELDIDKIPPFSAMVMASLTNTSKSQDSAVTTPPAKNNDILFPDQLSFFFAGAIAPKGGAFVQFTYDGTVGSFDEDNADVRFADHATLGSMDVLYGADLNNNPTVQDVWNTLSAWAFPFASSPVAPTPAAAAQIDGPLALMATGLSAYALWDNLLYTEVGAYRSSPTSTGRPLSGDNASNVIASAAPYWRVALQKTMGDHYIEVGTFGLAAKIYPGNASGTPTPLLPPTNDFTDTGLDAQYELQSGKNQYVARATWIHEKQSLNASSVTSGTNATDTLNTFRINGSYYAHGKYGTTLGYFRTTGTTDPVLYAPAPISGSATGSPNSNGEVVEFDYLPWLNTKFSLQYVAYNKFNGDKTNYDGFGRNAKDNNTLYALAWFAF